ncbi:MULTISPECIES: hypothetical protein [unclassified Acinetobacter]|uniref:hypothetical protein n=1 Tax=Acinetobacter TaxID=469 RepID=UPI0015D3F5DF|nr:MULTISPECIES: hypothetical protein [unclassified Acinetobacter]
MNNLFKNLSFAVLAFISVLTLQGCSSSLDPDTFSVELNEAGLYSWSTPVISIRSNTAEPIEVTNVIVNNGQCSFIGHDRRFNFPLHFQMGQLARLRVTKCSFANVVQVDIETTEGTVSYSFN